MPRRPLALLAGLLPLIAVAALLLLGAEDSAPQPADPPKPRAEPGRVAKAPDRGHDQSALPSRRERLRRIESRIRWRDSRAIGTQNAGRIVRGVRLPREGRHFFTWDSADWRRPSPPFRRHGTDRLIRVLLTVARDYAQANPGAPRIAVGDISLPGGGEFGARYGGVGEFGKGRDTGGHLSHQNGLDVDIYYPRRDRRERAPDALADVDRKLAQDLVDRFVAAGATFVFIGPRTGLDGPPTIVQPLALHDDHLHVRLPGS